jgi:hypothetical protein
MIERTLQATCRKGRPFAAYLYLARQTGAKSTRTTSSVDGLLVVDYLVDGTPVGVELTAPWAATIERVNALLGRRIDVNTMNESVT